jgi:biotin carboxyl carrier protein
MTEYIATIKDRKWNINLDQNSKVWVDGKEYHYQLHKLTQNAYLLNLDNKVYKISFRQIDSETLSLTVNTHNIDVTIHSAFQEKASKLIQNRSSAHHHFDIKAPMPGMIIKVKKNVGDAVQQGDSLLILEAMKMENDIRAPVSGIINKIFVKEGNPVEKGMLLISIE